MRTGRRDGSAAVAEAVAAATRGKEGAESTIEHRYDEGARDTVVLVQLQAVVASPTLRMVT